MTGLYVVFQLLGPVPGKIPGPFLLMVGIYAIARYAPVSASLLGTLLCFAVAMAADALTGHWETPQLGSVDPISATTFVVFFVLAWILGYGRPLSISTAVVHDVAVARPQHAGPVAVRIAVRIAAAPLTIEVENDPAPPGHRPVPGSGRGLIGMRERVTAFGGVLEAERRADGGWRLYAVLSAEPVEATP